MIVLNFSHPLTGPQLEQLYNLLTETIGEVKQVKCQLDHGRSFADQAREMLDSIGWTPGQWQGLRFLVNLPGMATAAACIVAQIHGRCGYFPSVIRLAPVVGATPPRFSVEEVLALAEQRDSARATR